MRLNLAVRIGSLTFVLLLIFVTSFVFVIASVQKTSEVIAIQNDEIHAFERVDLLARDFSNLRYWLIDLAIAGEFKSEEKVTKFQKKILKQLKYIASVSADGHGMESLGEKIAEYIDIMFFAGDSFLNDEFMEGNKLIIKARVLADAINQELEGRLLSASNKSKQAVKDVALNSENMVDASYLLMAFTLVFGSLLSYFLIRGIIKPVVAIRNAINQIEVESDLRIRVDSNSNSEVGDIAISVNKMLETFQSLIKKVSHSSVLVHESSDSMAKSSLSTSDSALQQQSKTSEISLSIDAMMESVKDVTQQSKEAELATNEASDQAAKGKQIISDNIDAITGLAEEMKKVNQVVKSLHSESTNIGAVVEVIQGIAAQTNLLALNAAIEAARAGEQGRGFAVVADEVRGLATRTQEATTKIEAMIERLQDGTNHAIVVMEESQRQTQATVELSSVAGNALASISNAVKTIYEIGITTSQSMTSQNEKACVVSELITDINLLTEVTTENAKSVVTKSMDVADRSKELLQYIEEFKIDDVEVF